MSMKKIKEFISNNIFLIPVLSAVVLRIYKLTSSSIWHDEGYTMWIIRDNFSDILARAVRDVHPPIYYLISKVWITIFGTSVESIRTLSLIFSVGIVYTVYLIVNEIWGKKAAYWSSLLVAFSPFMIRFGQEARMYGVVAFFTTLGTYFFVKYIKEKKNSYLVYYVLAMIIAMYTQYYSFFVIISHWVILAIYSKGFFKLSWKETIREKVSVFSKWWWVSNISLLLLYLPWFPIAYKQVTRISGNYWIKPEWMTIRTIPGNILQFITYNHLDGLFHWGTFGKISYWIIIILLIFSGIYLYKFREKSKIITSIYIFGYLPMLIVFAVSKIKTPIYQDRYFPFSAIALFVLWGIIISAFNKSIVRTIIGLAALVVLSFGIYQMHLDVNHQMKAVTDALAKHSQKGDKVYAGELYTFLDGSYYLGYGDIKLLSEPVDGYGESSLFYDQQSTYVTSKADVQNLGNRIWVLGKTGEKDYYSETFWSGWASNIYFSENKDNGLKLVLYTR